MRAATCSVPPVGDRRGGRPALVLAAHGSADPRHAPVVRAIADRVRGLRPGVDVRIGYLDHGGPPVAEVTGDACVVVPLLLARGYHVAVDLPRQATGAVVTAPLGPDPRLAVALADRLAEAGYGRAARDGTARCAGATGPVVLAAAGSSDPQALAGVGLAAGDLAERLGVEVAAAYLSAGEPRLRDLRPAVVATYLLAPGVFADAAARCGARVVAPPIGAHPAVAEIVVDRYDAAVAAQLPGRTAPA